MRLEAVIFFFEFFELDNAIKFNRMTITVRRSFNRPVCRERILWARGNNVFSTIF